MEKNIGKSLFEMGWSLL